MLKQILIAAVAVSLMAFGVTDAFAGRGDGRHGGGHYRGGHHSEPHHGGHQRGHGWHRYPSYSWYPRCHYEPRKVRIKVWDRRRRLSHKWVWRDVRVC